MAFLLHNYRKMNDNVHHWFNTLENRKKSKRRLHMKVGIGPKLQNKEGFTLVELMIVVAIIGILAAIAIPQFLTYQTRARNTSAAGDIHQALNSVETLNSDISCYGIPVSGSSLNNAPGGNGVVATLGGGAPLTPAQGGVAGLMMTGTNATTGAVGGVGFGLGNDIYINGGTEGANNASYVFHTQHERGNQAWGLDSDAPNTMYVVQNDAWTADTGALQFTAVAPTAGVNDFAPAGVPAAGGGGATTTWLPK